MSASKAPAARQQVVDLLVAALPSTRVTWGGPSEAEDIASEMVYLGSVTRTVEIRAMGSPATTTGMVGEEFSFPVIAMGELEGDNEKNAEVRAWALVDAIEQAVRGDLSLGGILNQGAGFGDQEVTTTASDAGWIYRASVELVCTAVI